MFRNFIKFDIKNCNLAISKFSQLITESNSSIKSAEQFNQVTNPENSVLTPLEEDISHISSFLKPTFNFAAYINKSETLQELLKLGVNLFQIEKDSDAVSLILSLKLRDIKEHILFLNDIGITLEQIGLYITKNPLIFKEEIENLRIRINYLKSKNFTDEMILRIIKANPWWLSSSTQHIDQQLGFVQKQFQLTGNEVRIVTTKAPKLITYSKDKIKLKKFVLEEEMGFSELEIKELLLKKPILFMRGQQRLLNTFEYLHKTMNISLEKILEEPEILNCRSTKLMQRHTFLDKLGRAQYDPKKPSYVALVTLVSGTDSYFSTEIAKSTIQTYNLFLKSL